MAVVKKIIITRYNINRLNGNSFEFKYTPLERIEEVDLNGNLLSKYYYDSLGEKSCLTPFPVIKMKWNELKETIKRY